MNKKNNPELVLPGGDLFRVKIALSYGADAVYIGLDKYSLRKAGVNFTIPQMKKAIEFAHSQKKKIYVTFNIFAHNQHLSVIEKDMKKIAALSPDAFIIADPGIIRIAKMVAPKIPIHLSTQANTVNSEDVKFWRDQGIKRVVLARELTLEEITEIHKAVPEMELEAFVHGAMCVSYSGRCLLSNYMTGRAANLGQCAQPCRWNYNVYLEEKQRPGEMFPIEETESGTNIMSSKDLRLVKYLPEILKAGVTGLKVEGRNKTEYYLATCALAYRKALNLIEKGKYSEANKNEAEAELEKLNYRDYTTGFIFGEAKKGEVYQGRSPIRKWDYVGLISKQEVETRNQKYPHEIVVKNKIVTGDEVEVLTPEGVKTDTVLKVQEFPGNEILEVNPGREEQKAYITFSGNYPENSLIRKKTI